MTETPGKLRILVVEDEESIRGGLCDVLAYHGYAPTAVETGEEGLEVGRREELALVILDLMLPGIHGLEVCRRLRGERPGLPILMLTARGEPQDEVSGLEAGADSYLAKPFSFDLLHARIHALLRPRADATDDNANTLAYEDLVLDLPGRTAYLGQRRIDLTTTEFNVLEFLLRNARQVLSKEQILEHVWGYDFEGDVNIVEVYVRLLRLKLEEFGEPRLIQTIRGAGYVLREP